MKRTSAKIAAVAGICLCLLGCHSHEDHGHEADQGHEEHGQAEHDPGHDSHGSGLQLTLNDGEKWPVDQSTGESATKIAALVDDAESIRTVEAARALGQALDEELDTLVKGCTMTGPAHDQLHVFLVALFPQVEALKGKTDVTELQRAREEIGDLIEAYSTHFE